MKHRLRTSLVFTLTGLIACPPSLRATGAADPVASEAAVRKADADWAATTSTASANAWMSFYAADAIVLLPHDQIASGTELIRQTVTRLLALPHVSLVSRPIDVKVASSGEVALLMGVYELRFDDEHGSPVSDRGRRLEIWRRQSDGSWKCSVDTWNLDEAHVISTPLASAQGASPTAVSPPPARPTPAAALQPGLPSTEAASKYGDMPVNYAAAIRQYFLEHLKHPESAQYREISQPEQGYTTEITGGLLMREKREYGWKVQATINSKDSHDRYVGFKTYTFLFRGETITDARSPLPSDELK
jgi:ketosteroid isomerase-like protein